MSPVLPALLLCCALTVGLSTAAAAESASAEPRPADAAAVDPWERYNRGMYRFNRGFDRFFLRPVARGYKRVVPEPLRGAFSRFFDNLQEPVVSLNLLLQGRPGQAGSALGRFALNTTLGAGGLLDPASAAGIPDRSADFGQTLARWGWRDSRFLVLPLFGPATVRDTVGKAINTEVSPIDWLARREGAEISLLYGVDARSRALAAEAFLADASDEYALVRDSYLQYRHCQVVDCSGEVPEYLLPDYEFELPELDLDTLRR